MNEVTYIQYQEDALTLNPKPFYSILGKYDRRATRDLRAGRVEPDFKTRLLDRDSVDY